MQCKHLKQSYGVWMSLIVTIAMIAFPISAHARDRGVNQPGVAGNAGAAFAVCGVAGHDINSDGHINRQVVTNAYFGNLVSFFNDVAGWRNG